MFQLIDLTTREPTGITCGTYEKAYQASLILAAKHGKFYIILKKEEPKPEHLLQDSGRLLPA